MNIAFRAIATGGSSTYSFLSDGQGIMQNSGPVDFRNTLTVASGTTFGNKVTISGTLFGNTATFNNFTASGTPRIFGNIIISGTIFGNGAGLSGLTSDHNLLQNLQGGQSGQYYHATATDYANRVTTDNQVTLTNKSIPAISGTVVITNDLNVLGNIHGNITESNFGTITTNSLIFQGPGNLVVSGTYFGNGAGLGGLNYTQFGMKLVGKALQKTNITVSGTSININSTMAGEVAGGGDAAEGIVTTNPFNRAILKDTNFDDFLDTTGNSVYSRVTYSAPNWLLTFYVFDSSEKPYVFSSGRTAQLWVQKIYNPTNVSVYDSVFDVPSDQTAGGVPDATTTVAGKVLLGSSSDTAALRVVQTNDTRLTNSRIPTGSAGGDLAGSYPNPTVAKMTNPAISGTLFGGAGTFTSLSVGGNAIITGQENVSGNLIVSGTLFGNGSGLSNLNTFQWIEVTNTSANMARNSGYIANNAGLVTLTLPSSPSVGDYYVVSGKGAGLWKIAQNANQIINFGNKTTTTGITGYLSSTLQYDSVSLVCVVAGTTFNVYSSIGSITIA